MKKMHKLVCLFLALLMTSSLFAACGESGSESDDKTAADTNQSETIVETTELEARQAIPDDLPDDKNYEGYEFRILTYQPTIWEVEELTGEIVSDSKYDRQTHVQDRFNAKIVAAPSDSLENADAAFRAAVTSGDDSYDLASLHQIYSGPGLIMSHMVVDWNTVPYINQEKPWWNQTINQTINLFGKQYYIAGIISLPSPFAMMVNRDYVTNYGFDDIYSLVKENKWTMDKFTEMVTTVKSDLNGDGAMTPETDQYGLSFNNDNQTLNFMYAFGIQSVLLDENSMPVPNTNTEKMMSVVEKVYDITYNSGSAMLTDYTTQWTVGTPAFSEGRVMFKCGEIGDLSSMREFDINIGIIPYPMWDEVQDRYYTHVDAYNGMLCISVCAENLERTGIITEAMAAYTYKYCSPAYYEVALGTKYVQDPESVEMLDIIFDSIIYDFGYIFDNWKGCTWTLPRMIQQKRTDVASYWKGVEKSVNKNYTDLYAAITEEE